MTRCLLVAVCLLFCCTACGAGNGAGTTQLILLVVNPDVGRATFHLRCNPSGGDMPDTSAACAALRQKPQLVTTPKPFNCKGDEFSHWQVTITGRLDAKPIRRTFDTCWTPQMETIRRLRLSWDSLKRHLDPRTHEVVLPGETRQFPPGSLQPADLVTCDILGHHLQVGIPIERGPGARVSNGFSGLKVVSVNLVVERHSDGSVKASCMRGSG